MEFPVDLFKSLMGKVSICVASDKLKPILCGANISFIDEGSKMNLVSTDGKRLANAVIDDLSAFKISGDVSKFLNGVQAVGKDIKVATTWAAASAFMVPYVLSSGYRVE